MATPIIYLVPHTHYDAIWVFNKEDYYYINIEFILKQAVQLMKTTDYKFLIEQTFLLEHIENAYPELFADIRALARENKIEVAGGQYPIIRCNAAKWRSFDKGDNSGKKICQGKTISGRSCCMGV